VRVSWPLPDLPPSVTIIVPTRDRVDLLDACIRSLLRETRYPHYDVLIVDNGSTEPDTHDWFMTISADPRVSVLGYDHPYNYSAINNFAAAHARGEYLCLLNNDTEIVDGAWLDELMRYAIRPGVGAVGAKLLYDDGSIQHAGVVMGLGNAAGHSHRALPNEQAGYFAQAHCAHYASAVTAACLVVERAKFEAVGGLDEVDLQIAYNDVDFCLKLERKGWRNVYAPQAVLIHYESKSRGQDMAPQHIERYKRELAILQERWDTHVVTDPMHHPRLDRSSETYRIHL
jgi:GT2 family glycosyltransferase